ncbi:hypothetical protein SUGI_0096350 [Cryptomeria japonica]|nr:hypothetical protein SUGI_0096350 [Cryptomeria japonica]
MFLLEVSVVREFTRLVTTASSKTFLDLLSRAIEITSPEAKRSDLSTPFEVETSDNCKQLDFPGFVEQR